MKKIYFILGFIILVFLITLLIVDRNNNVNYVEDNNLKLALFVDGEEVSELSLSDKYVLTDYTCRNGTILTWDYNTSVLTSSSQKYGDDCILNFKTFESSPKLYDLVNIGDYISYTGDNGCSSSNCSGWNANQTATDLYENFGYCYDIGYLFYTYGWRVLYKNNGFVYIVSAGAPECVFGGSGGPTSIIAKLDTAALKYCNSNYISGGICDVTTAHAFNGDDFYKFTSQYNGKGNARYLYNYDDGGTFGSPYCYGSDNKIKDCGYTKDIIDNGGQYWFGSAYSSIFTLIWTGSYVGYHLGYTNTNGNSIPLSFGVRPVLKLDSSLLATGGLGTMTDPYTISERTTS